MVENRFKWFDHVERRLVNSVVRRVDQIEDSHITRGRPREIVRQTIEKDLQINELDRNMVCDRTLWHNLIIVADTT